MIEPLERPIRVAEVDLTIRPAPHVFAPERRAAILDGFARLKQEKPALWNGPFFLFDQLRIETADGARLIAEGAATDFATFLDWRAGDPLDRRFAHVFPVGAIVTADDRLLVGRMGAHTANPGRLYPPSGSFDPQDLADGRLDPVANAVREIDEEVGLDPTGWASEPGFWIVPSGVHRYAIVKVYRAPETAAALQARVEAFLPDGSDGELDGVVFVRLDDRLDPALSAAYVNPLLAELARSR